MENYSAWVHGSPLVYILGFRHCYQKGGYQWDAGGQQVKASRGGGPRATKIAGFDGVPICREHVNLTRALLSNTLH